MKINILSIDEISELEPCSDGFKYAKAHTNWWEKCERGDWLVWYLRKTDQLPKPLAVAIAIACAEHVLVLFSKKYPNDNRPATAIGAAKKWLAEPTEENQEAAAEAANAAAANAAAEAAAYAESAYTAYTAYSAASAAWTAARSAAYAAAAAYANAEAAAYAESAAAAAAAAADAASERKWQADKIRELCEAYNQQ
jgi:hypothetical protein